MNKFLKILLINSVTFSLFSGPDEDLLAAAINGDLVGVKAALDARADVNAVDAYEDTALAKAARYGYINIVKLLLDRGANISTTDNDENTALIMAAGGGHTAVVRLLLNIGADINAINNYESTALPQAAGSVRKDAFSLLKDRLIGNSSRINIYIFNFIVV